MPLNRDYIDKYAMVGRAKLAPVDELEVKATSSSRSLNKVITLLPKIIKIEHRKDGYFCIDINNILGTKIKVSRTNMNKLARWVLNGDKMK